MNLFEKTLILLKIRILPDLQYFEEFDLVCSHSPDALPSTIFSNVDSGDVGTGAFRQRRTVETLVCHRTARNGTQFQVHHQTAWSLVLHVHKQC